MKSTNTSILEKLKSAISQFVIYGYDCPVETNRNILIRIMPLLFKVDLLLNQLDFKFSNFFGNFKSYEVVLCDILGLTINRNNQGHDAKDQFGNIHELKCSEDGHFTFKFSLTDIYGKVIKRTEGEEGFKRLEEAALSYKMSGKTLLALVSKTGFGIDEYIIVDSYEFWKLFLRGKVRHSFFNTKDGISVKVSYSTIKRSLLEPSPELFESDRPKEIEYSKISGKIYDNVNVYKQAKSGLMKELIDLLKQIRSEFNLVCRIDDREESWRIVEGGSGFNPFSSNNLNEFMACVLRDHFKRVGGGPDSRRISDARKVELKISTGDPRVDIYVPKGCETVEDFKNVFPVKYVDCEGSILYEYFKREGYLLTSCYAAEGEDLLEIYRKRIIDGYKTREDKKVKSVPLNMSLEHFEKDESFKQQYEFLKRIFEGEA